MPEDMSVLYQALKRHDESQRGTASTPVQATGTTRQYDIWPFVLGFLVICVGGLFGLLLIQPGVETTAPGHTPAPPVTAPTSNAADNTALPAPDNTTAHEQLDIETIAAMLPEQAQEPLPLPSLHVGEGQSGRAIQERAQHLHKQGATVEAERLYGTQPGDFSSAVNRWGLVAQDDPEAALPHLRRLVRQRPDNAAARAQLGMALARLGAVDEAEDALTTAAVLDPGNAQIWYNLAVLADQQGRTRVAEDAYANALLRAADDAAGPATFDPHAVQRRLNYLRGR